MVAKAFLFEQQILERISPGLAESSCASTFENDIVLMDIAHYDNKAWLHRVVTFKGGGECPDNRLTFFSITPLNDYMSTERIYDGSIPTSTHWADKKIETDSNSSKPMAIVRTNVQNGPL